MSSVAAASAAESKNDTFTVGVLGGGQLGRMMAEAAHNMRRVKVLPLDPLGTSSPAGQVAGDAVEGSFKDPEAIRRLAERCDVITAEIEHVNCEVLHELVQNGMPVLPHPACIELIQDKYVQKLHFQKNGVALGPFQIIEDVEAARQFGQQHGYPFMLKARRGAYDGKGNFRVGSEADVEEAFQAMASPATGGCYAESWMEYETEIAVMVVKSETTCRSFPVVDFMSVNSILFSTRCPASVSPLVRANAQKIAERAVCALPPQSYGVFGVELFALPDGSVYLNEIAPRPHNSGHYTIEACGASQFEAHLHAVLSHFPSYGADRVSKLDLSLRVGAATMVNMVEGKGFPPAVFNLDECPGAGMHWYGKAVQRVGRKMAHATLCGANHAEIFDRLTKASSDVADLAYSTGRPPLVGVIMGSDSDLPCMKAAVEVLEQFEVPHEVTIVSAHRTPERMCRYARNAQGRGLKVIIAGAGGAAHLPGMVAAMTPLPVVGVPVKTSTLSGVDSLYSIVQMPRGVPVATVAIGNAKNAGLLAVRMIAGCTGNVELLEKLEVFRSESSASVLQKAEQLEEQGTHAYLQSHERLKSKTVM